MGFRTHDEDGALDTMSLDEFLIGNREATFMLESSGSLKEEGILEGDLLLIDRSKDPRRGDIVVVVEDGSFALKRLSAIGSDSKVEAVVTAVIRKLI